MDCAGGWPLWDIPLIAVAHFNLGEKCGLSYFSSRLFQFRDMSTQNIFYFFCWMCSGSCHILKQIYFSNDNIYSRVILRLGHLILYGAAAFRICFCSWKIKVSPDCGWNQKGCIRCACSLGCYPGVEVHWHRYPETPTQTLTCVCVPQ